MNIEKGTLTSDGRYEVIKKIGEGGMGVVFEAFDKILRISVALKFQKEGAVAEERTLFIREARAMAHLHGHSHVVPIFNIGTHFNEDEPMLYIASEYLTGGNAESLIGTSDLVRYLELGISTTKALSYAHKKGIIHRDVKPSNILIDSDNNFKINDFGLSKFLLSEKSSVTSKHYVSENYAAPEQLGANPISSAKTDIFQFGATLYHLITGRPYDIAKGILLHDFEDNIPPDLIALLKETLSHDPEKRPSNFEQIGYVLEDVFFLIDPEGINRNLPKHYILHGEPFVRIRSSLKDKVKRAIHHIVTFEKSKVVPRIDKGEMPRWYATVLLRPYKKVINGKKDLSDDFYCIYFASYEAENLISWSDWVRKYQLILTSHDIHKCCSGLPIRWYEEKDTEFWKKDEGKFWFCSEDRDTYKIRYFALSNVNEARQSEDNIVAETYMGDSELGWEFRTLEGEEDPMSKKIETEILIPIYDPFSEGGYGDSIIGIANFEWDEKFSKGRIEQIGHFLSREIQVNNKFAISEFICEVLHNITLGENLNDPT